MDRYTELADRYIAVWNEADEGRRGELIAQTYSEGATYVDPMMEGEGHAGLNTMISDARAQFPGHSFRRSSNVEAHHDRVRFSWELAPDVGPPVALGTDVGVVTNGRFSSVIGFLDQVPG